MPSPADAVLAEALGAAARSGALPREGSILLAVSGGADSLALLHAAADVAGETGWRLTVGHVHHGWRGRDADRDVLFVREHARRRGLDFVERHGDARSHARTEGLSPEAGARSLRYAALHEMAAETGSIRIATAHHRDDRIESYLIARERHGGVASRGGPRAWREDGVVRPFLGVFRRDLAAFLGSRGLSWRRDSTNGDLSLARNRVRREIAAATERQRGEWDAEAALAAETRDRLDAEYRERVEPLLRRGPGAVLVDAEALAGMPAELVRHAIEAAAIPFARPGRAAMTGREREQVLDRIFARREFRFEAGRRIAVEMRAGVLGFALRRRLRDTPGDANPNPVYDFVTTPPSGDVHRWNRSA